MRVSSAGLPEVLIVEPDVHHDGRGFFLESYHQGKYRSVGILDVFVQDNHSKSIGGTIRGLHLQSRQAKLVRVISGEIYDVAVDLRRGSPTFGRWSSVTLSAENFLQCYVPAGFAHGFAVVSASAEVEYKVTELYDRAAELGVAWNDPTLAITWPPLDPRVMSDRDGRNPLVADILDRLPQFVAP